MRSRIQLPKTNVSFWTPTRITLTTAILALFIEAIWYLFLKYKGFRKADLRSPATIRVQENEKS